MAAHYETALERELVSIGRSHTHVRLVVSGVEEDEDE